MTDKRRLLTTILLVAGSLILGFVNQIRIDVPKEQSNPTWALFVGFSVFIGGLIIFQSQKAYGQISLKLQKAADWLEVTDWQIVLLFISLVFVFLAAMGAGLIQKMYSPVIAVISWIFGIGLAFIGGYQWDQEKPTISKSTILLSIIVFVIAFLFRGFGTGTIPLFLTGDEAASGIIAAQFKSGDWNNIFITRWYSFPTLFSFIQSIFIEIFGQTTEALRILSALVGALTVVAAYLCGKVMFGNRAGMLAALSLSAFHFHINFSRLGLNNIWDGLWYTVTIGALWYGWENNKRLGYLFAGLALGFSQYFYASSKGLLGIIILGIFLAFLFNRHRLYQSIPNLVPMFIVSIAVIFPLLRFYIHEPLQFLAPLYRASFFLVGFGGPVRPITGALWKLAAEQILVSAQAYTYAPIQYWYAPEVPILRPMFATLFYIGLIFLILRNRDSRFVALTLWLVIFVLIGGLSESPLASQRYVAAAPACALIIGYGLHKITEFFENLWQKYSRVVVGLSYLIIGVAMISDLYFYFIEFQGIYQISNIDSNGTIAQELANHLKGEPDGTQIAFFGSSTLGYYSIPSIQYLAPQVKGIDVTTRWQSFDKTLLSGKHIIFVFLPQRRREISRIMAEYPNGSLNSQKAWNNQTLFWIYDYSSKSR
jgi:4-amino-4-deoxy-L-arabinose transferase-like glycosyltransferase